MWESELAELQALKRQAREQRARKVADAIPQRRPAPPPPDELCKLSLDNRRFVEDAVSQAKEEILEEI